MKKTVFFVMFMLTAFVACSPNLEDLSRDEATEYMNKAFKSYDKGNYKKAHKILKAVYLTGLESGTLYFRLGFCEDHLDQNKKTAMGLYRKAIDYFKENPDEDVDTYKKAYKNYGRLYVVLGNESMKRDEYSEALAYYNGAKQIWDEALGTHSENEYVSSEYYLVLENIEEVKRVLEEKSVGSEE